MILKEGSTRIVVIGPKEVIKVAKGFQYDVFLQEDEPRGIIERYLSTGAIQDLEALAELIKTRGAVVSGTVLLQKQFDGGLAANKLEEESSIDGSLAGLIVPTKFSVEGLVNVQDFTPDVPYYSSTGKPSGNIFWSQVEALMDRGLDVFAGGHTIGSPENFGLHDGQIKFRDYGDRDLIAALISNRERIREALDGILVSLNNGVRL